MTQEAQREYNRRYRQKNRGRIVELKRKYRALHLEQAREWANKYAHSHPDEMRTRRAALVPLRHNHKNPRWQSFDARMQEN